MPTSAEPTDLLVDTSVAVALVLSDHEHHDRTVKALAGRRLGLCGHAAFETFSVLTRLPPPARRTPAAVGRLLAFNFPATCFLDPKAAASLLERLPALHLPGGSVYDALVGATAATNRLVLATRNLRALPTYRALDVSLELLD
jgi:predicted nucleic acid-binding protein